MSETGYSLNEVEGMAKKATRGAGFSWGLAEEAGKATRWLCAQGLHGVEELAAHLATPCAPPREMTPAMWLAAGPLCPLQTGAALSDFAHILQDGPLKLVDLAHPGLILPFASNAARQLGAVVMLNCNGLIARTDGRGVSLKRIPGPPGTSDVEVSLTEAMTEPLPPETRAHPRPDAWEALKALAARTHAPATEASRLKGAGAGLSDND